MTAREGAELEMRRAPWSVGGGGGVSGGFGGGEERGLVGKLGECGECGGGGGGGREGEGETKTAHRTRIAQHNIPYSFCASTMTKTLSLGVGFEGGMPSRERKEVPDWVSVDILTRYSFIFEEERLVYIVLCGLGLMLLLE